MKNFLLSLVILFTINSCDAQVAENLKNSDSTIDTAKVILPENDHPKISQVVSRIFSRYHYNKTEMNDSLSSKIFDKYIQMLDNNKLYFLQSDINGFEKFRYELDEDIYSGNLEPGYEIFNTYKKRFQQRIEHVFDLLNKGFDFSKDEYYQPEREDEPWAISSDQLDEQWRKRIKNEWLNLKLEGKEPDKIKELLTNRYKNFHKAILQYNSEDVFQLYLNSYAEIIDPHTSYFSPHTSDNFKINMSLSLEGIGAQLTTENDYTKVVRIIKGGPADKSKNLEKDDKIIGVAQGEDGEMIDVIGWRIDDVVAMIRGEKGTTVRLSVIRADAGADAAPEEIKLVRDKVKLEDQAAQKSEFDVDENAVTFNIGVIEIPTFYMDFEGKNRGDKDYKSTTKDVMKILEDLKNDNVDGVIIDLRNNGGGSLQEAVDLTGLFIKDGPVVQVRNSNGYVDVEYDPDNSIAYEGPLAVLVNRYSASASEIFSGAIQDYERGIVVGEQTFGKGTVQNLIDLNRFIPSKSEKRGEIKLTIAKYYRVTGSSTQNLGVVPDITYPTAVDPKEFGESSEESALPWDEIEPTDYRKFSDLDKYIPTLLEKHKQRVSNNIEFNYIMEDIEEYHAKKAKKEYSLNEEKRKEERELADLKKKERDDQRAKNSDLEIVEKEEVTKNNIKVDDPLLEETGHILADLILLSVG